MQVTKTYSGSVSLSDTFSAREVSYGVANTINVQPAKVDIINNTIANFLRQECGVNAWYEQRSGSAYKFLWIYNVPFLFNIAGNNSYAAFYGPLNAGALNAGADGTSTATVDYNKGLSKFFNGATGEYNFGLVFAGNAQNGFSLRFKTYMNANISPYFMIRMMKCTNIINSRVSVVWSGQNVYSTNNITVSGTQPTMLGGMNGIDLNADNTINADSFSTYWINYDPMLHTKLVHKDFNSGAIPLVPLYIGPYRANGIYLRPQGFNLPYAVGTAVEIQAEMTVSGRSFLITNSDAITFNTINMGLIETT